MPVDDNANAKPRVRKPRKHAQHLNIIFEACLAARPWASSFASIALPAPSLVFRTPHFTTRPSPNWSPVRTGFPPANWISTIFSLSAMAPVSSFSVATILRVATSITWPVEG